MGAPSSISATWTDSTVVCADIPIEKINCKNKIIFFIFMLALIPQHYYKLNFLSNWVGKLQKEEQRSNRRYSSLSIFCI
ncbi:hypothetical protein DXD25_12440 [Prevotella sp. TF12-30]|nr:hypothetical protein DXD25_12440 [Prevotella sp. TF12-30]